MNALEYLKHDHDKVKRLSEQFEGAKDDAAKAAAATDAIALLKVHTTIEEEIFYPAIRKEAEDVDDIVAEGIEEHHVADTLIAEIEGLRPTDEAWEAKVKVMFESVEHHVGEEEDDMFPKVRESLPATRLQELGTEMAGRADELQYETMSRDALYALAKERGIEGRSDMTKAEIVTALTEARRAGSPAS
jgi:hemerythrin-like domain-containing protein